MELSVDHTFGAGKSFFHVFQPSHSQILSLVIVGGVQLPTFMWNGLGMLLSICLSGSLCRSVHNIRIERLWSDVTRGFGLKWSNFFLELEFGCGLNPTFDAHIWLIQHLFLSDIHDDAKEWAGAWNTHKLRIAKERTRSPRDMFFFGMIQNGARGLEDIMGTGCNPVDLSDDSDEEVEDIAQYGVDWEDLNDPAIIAHHNQYNEGGEEAQVGFFNYGPAELSHVEIDEPLCPFSSEQVHALDYELASLSQFRSRNMVNRRAVWIHALAFCRQLELQHL